MKKSKTISLLLLFVCIALLVMSSASANIFSDLWGKITGHDTSATTALNITIGNAAPTVPSVYINTSYDPTIATTRFIVFNFTASDTDGFSNINTSTGAVYFQKAGETTRSNTTCQSYTGSGNSMNFSCNVTMWYFDQNGAWTINATIKDTNNAYGENSTATFNYNLLTAMVMSPTSLSWGAVGVATTNAGSNNDPIQINNSGNDEPLSINVTSYSLQGVSTTSQYIYANNFTVENATEGCSGTAMANATSTNVTSAILYRGNNSINNNSQASGQEQIYTCLKGVNSDLSAQSYTSGASGPWTVAIIT